MGRYPTIYRVTDTVAESVNLTPLAGTLETAQEYCDEITSSIWWFYRCPPTWLGIDSLKGIPDRVLLIHEPSLKNEAGLYADRLMRNEGRLLPAIELGEGEIYNGVPILADQWTLLHELAHVWTVENTRTHGPHHALAFYQLVKHSLGEEVAAELREAMNRAKMRVPWTLILP